MKSYHMSLGAGLEGLVLKHHDTPTPEPGEVVALGAGVSRTKVGDRVVASIFPQWMDGPFGLAQSAQLGGSLDGMLTEYAELPEAALVPIPAHLSYDEAATLPCAGVTAWNALTGGVRRRGGLRWHGGRGAKQCWIRTRCSLRAPRCGWWPPAAALTWRNHAQQQGFGKVVIRVAS